jgi:hypothetical protein
MAKRPPGLVLDQKGDGFVLRRTDDAGKTATVTLTKEDIITLSQSIPSLRDHILAGQSLGASGISAVAVTEVAQIVLNHDVHRSEIHLTMIDRYGARVGFALPLEIAQLLADRLPARLDLIERTARTRTYQ